MASIQRPGTHLTSPDAGFYNTGGSHRNFNANLDKSHSFRDSHEGRPGAGSIPQGAGSSSNGELPPLSSVLCLDCIPSDNRSGRHLELRRAINAACGSQVEDPSLGNIQAKPLGSLGIEDLKRVRSSLSENALKARYISSSSMVWNVIEIILLHECHFLMLLILRVVAMCVAMDCY